MFTNLFGTIFVQLDKGSYSPGDQVNGQVFCDIRQNCPGSSEIWVRITGMEDTQVVEAKTRDVRYHENGQDKTRQETYYVTHNQMNSFFDHMIPIYKFNTFWIPAGQYTFPFCFVLQQGLPSTFNYEFKKHGNGHARVNYIIEAKVKGQLNVFADIRCQQAFTVNQAVVFSLGSQKKEMKQNIVSCCCIGKGDTAITTYFEKAEYTPGETAFMICEVDNSRCKADIVEIKGIFRQNLKVTARTYTEHLVIDHQVITLKGIRGGENLMGPNAKRLSMPIRGMTGEVQPTSRGKLVSNEYVLVNSLSMDACICCDNHPACELGLTVRNPDLVYTPWQAPSNWAPQQMSMYTISFTDDYRMPEPQGIPNLNMNVNMGMPAMPQPPNQNMNVNYNSGMPPNPGMPNNNANFSMNINMNGGMPGQPGMPGQGRPGQGMPGMPPNNGF